jgi:hypothetical protein
VSGLKVRATARPAEGTERIEGPVLGRVLGVNGGDLRVSYPGSPEPSLVARALSSVDESVLARAVREGTPAVLLFEDGDPRRPLLLGVLRSTTPLVDALVEGMPEGKREARVDGRRVVVEGRDEVTLRCGKASLTLRADGKVVLRGVNLVSQADQVHKIRGGKVQVN